VIRLLSIAAALAVLTFGGARADTLYHQDFQSGVAPEWGAAGDGDVRLSTYAGNTSLRFAGHAYSRTDITARAFRNIVVRAKIAALGLGPADGCYAEVSPDAGATWVTALSVRKGQDDGVSMVDAAFSDPRIDGRARLTVRFRADLSNQDAACWGDDIDVEGAAPVAIRSQPLDLATLTGPAPLTGLTPVAAFMPGPNAQMPAARLEGRLELHPAKVPDGMAVLADNAPARGPDPRAAWPGLAVELVQDGSRIIPVQRGPVVSGSPEWDWVIEPGQAWTDPADGGFSRVVLPVALEERNANCLHNGRLLLLFKSDGSVSRAAVQFDEDTCAYFKFDAWSLVAATYRPGPVAGAGGVIARDRAERAARPPLKPLDALAGDHPGVDAAALTRAAGPSAVFGLFDGAAHYAGPCHTRAGDDPLCAERPLPSYSTAKSLVAAQALFRLEALRPGTIDEKVADHVPYCAARGGWGDVRLIDLLDMASGHYDSAAPNADEDAPAMHAFFVSTTEAQKIAFACDKPRKSPPGTVWVYHTFDTFLLGVALTDVVRKAGLGDYYDSLIRPIWAAIGQSPDLDDTRRTYDAAAQPFSGWGLTYHRDDAIRAARFLADGGRIDGRPYLDPALLSQALQTASPGGGFVALQPHIRYRHGVWARDVGPLVGCKQPVWAAYLSGFGGISVVMFPNRVVFYAFNDENHFDWGSAVPEIDKIRSLCP
jgi:hypothetical protein